MCFVRHVEVKEINNLWRNEIAPLINQYNRLITLGAHPEEIGKILDDLMEYPDYRQSNGRLFHPNHPKIQSLSTRARDEP